MALDYVERAERGESVRAESVCPDPGEEKFFVGLRLTEGVLPDDADWRRLARRSSAISPRGCSNRWTAGCASPAVESGFNKFSRSFSPHERPHRH